MRTFTVHDPLMQQPSATGDINATAPRPEPVVEWPDAGQDLPEQMGGARSTLPPGLYTFAVPATLAQLWHDIEAEDRRKFLANGQPNPSLGQKFKRKQLKFDRNVPLVVMGGPLDGQPMTATFSTHPRPRGKADDPKTAWISDAAYLLDVGLGDKSRPSDPQELMNRINAHAGKSVRLETGLSAQCRPDKVRYIRITVGDGEQDLPDPTGTKGCGKRYYTTAFKNPQGGMVDPVTQKPIPMYDTEIACDCSTPTPEQAAQGRQPATVVLKAYEQVERILPPLGA